MIDPDAHDEKVHEFDDWKCQKLVVSLKPYVGKMFIDVRKWIIPNDTYSRRSKGIMLDVDKWPVVIGMVQEILDRQKGK